MSLNDPSQIPNLLRLKQIIAPHGPLPVSRATFYHLIATGQAPNRFFSHWSVCDGWFCRDGPTGVFYGGAGGKWGECERVDAAASAAC